MNIRSQLIARIALGLIVCFVAAGLASTHQHVEAAASELSVSQTCTAGRLSVMFSWKQTSSPIFLQWLDLGSNAGFQPGSFQGAGPLPPPATSYTWDGVAAGSILYARVNTLLANGAWDPGPTLSFNTQTCSPALSVVPYDCVRGLKACLPACTPDTCSPRCTETGCALICTVVSCGAQCIGIGSGSAGFGQTPDQTQEPIVCSGPPAKVDVVLPSTLSCGSSTAATAYVTDLDGFAALDGTSVVFTTTAGSVSSPRLTAGGTAVASLNPPPRLAGSLQLTVASGPPVSQRTLSITC